jgi:photosystem II stability/assembly factor-like uncharacterized protein
MAVESPPNWNVEPSPDQAPDAGVIKDARARQRRHQAAAAILALALAGIVAAFLTHGGGGSRSNVGRGVAAPGRAPLSGKARSVSADAAYRTVLPSISEMGLLAPGVGWAANGISFDITRNSGRSWRDVPVPGLRGDIVANLTAAASPGPSDLVLASYAGSVYGSCAHPTGPANSHGIELPIGKMAVSSDAGRTWRSTTLPGCVLPASLSFLNPKVGFAVMLGGSNPLRPALYVTTDGARTWRPIGPMPFSGPIDFTSSDDGWGVAANFIEPEALDTSQTGALYRTTDGGRTWEPATICPAGSTQETTVACETPHFFGDREGVVPAVVVNHKTGRDSLVVYSTTDSGRTWSRHALPSDTQLRSYVARPEPVPFSAPSASDIFTIIAGRLYATTNGGRTWSTITPKPPLPGFASLDFASNTYGWVIATNAFDYTTDSGKSWNPLAKQ